MNRTNSLLPIIFLLVISYGEGYAQWEKANLPDSVRVNTIKISDPFIFAGTDGEGVFVSTDDGENWTSSNKGLQDTFIHTIMILDDTIFAGTETGVSVSTDNGESWRSISSGLSGLGVWSLAVSVDTAGDTTLFAGSWSGVYSSTDRGENWKVTSLSSTTSPVHSIAISGDTIWAATLSEGIFLSRDNGSTWIYHDIKPPDSTTNYFPIPVSVPICSISLFAGLGQKDIMVGSIGYLYHGAYWDTIFVGDNSLTKLSYEAEPIFCFASRNDTLFTAVGGNLFKLAWGYFPWYVSGLPDPIGTIITYGVYPLNIPYLGDRTVYSLALNNAYIFAGTEGGIWRLSYPLPTTRVESPQEIPSGFALEQNYPNPFNPTTTISYQLAASSDVILKVYDMLGREVASLVNEKQNAGTHLIRFDGSNLPSGTYFYRLHCGSYAATKKLLLLK
jgi:hypothetical protein